MHSTAVLIEHDPAVRAFPGTDVLRIETYAIAWVLKSLHAIKNLGDRT